MYQANDVVLSAKNVIISKVPITEQVLCADLLTNMLEVAYNSGRVDAMAQVRA